MWTPSVYISMLWCLPSSAFFVVVHSSQSISFVSSSLATHCHSLVSFSVVIWCFNSPFSVVVHSLFRSQSSPFFVVQSYFHSLFLQWFTLHFILNLLLWLTIIFILVLFTLIHIPICFLCWSGSPVSVQFWLSFSNSILSINFLSSNLFQNHLHQSRV